MDGESVDEIVPAGPAAHDAMRGQSRGGSIDGIDEREDVVPGRVALAGPVGAAFGAVAQRRLVAVVAVGDGQRRGGHEVEQRMCRGTGWSRRSAGAPGTLASA